MTSVEIYDAIATLLEISNTDAEILANYLMTLTLGRNTTESSSWTMTPPAQRNDLQSSEKTPTKLLNSLSSKSPTVEAAVNGFSSRFSNVIGNENGEDKDIYDSLTEEEGNLLRFIHSLKTKNLKVSGGTMTGQLNAGGDLEETVAQVRNSVILPAGTTDFSSVPNNTLIFVKEE